MSRWIVRGALAVTVGVPLVVLALGASSIRWFFPQVLPKETTLGPATRLITASETTNALRTSVVISLAVTVIALVLAWPAARALARPGATIRGVAFAILLLPSIVPAVGLAVGIDVGLLNLGVDGTMAAVVAAHLVLALPYTVAVLTAAFLRHDEKLEDQASALGASPAQVLLRVTVPSMRTGLAAAAALTVLVSWSQYLLTFLAGSGRVVTITMLLFDSIAGGSPASIATLALLTTVPVIVVITAVGTPVHREVGPE